MCLFYNIDLFLFYQTHNLHFTITKTMEVLREYFKLCTYVHLKKIGFKYFLSPEK